MRGTLAILDDDGNEVVLDAEETAALVATTDCLDAATVSACPTCRVGAIPGTPSGRRRLPTSPPSDRFADGMRGRRR
jgi:hypothetical protein